MTYFLLKSCTCTKIKIITRKHYQTCFCSESFIPSPPFAILNSLPPLLLSPTYFSNICFPPLSRFSKISFRPIQKGGEETMTGCATNECIFLKIYFQYRSLSQIVDLMHQITRCLYSYF